MLGQQTNHGKILFMVAHVGNPRGHVINIVLVLMALAWVLPVLTLVLAFKLKALALVLKELPS